MGGGFTQNVYPNFRVSKTIKILKIWIFWQLFDGSGFTELHRPFITMRPLKYLQQE